MKLGSLLQSGEHFAVVIQNNAAYRLLAGEEGTSLNLQDWISRPDALRKAALKAMIDSAPQPPLARAVMWMGRRLLGGSGLSQWHTC